MRPQPVKCFKVFLTGPLFILFVSKAKALIRMRSCKDSSELMR